MDFVSRRKAETLEGYYIFQLLFMDSVLKIYVAIDIEFIHV